MSNAKTDTKQAALDILHKGVADLMSSEGWKRALDFRRRFHTYSFFNTNLILAQKPDAQLVAGYRAWTTNNRFVRKGEKGITILAPLLRKDPDDPHHRILTGFKTVHVFDISQTEGDPIPLPEPPRLLQDTPEDHIKLASLKFRLAMLCASKGVSVTWDFQHPTALGVYRPDHKRIQIKADLSHTQGFKTLCHEAAHMLLHTASDDRTQAELEAETTAYLTCHALGINTNDYSFAYLASWTGDLETLIQAGDRASKAADQILEHLQADPDTPTAEPMAEPTTNPPTPGHAPKHRPVTYLSS